MVWQEKVGAGNEKKVEKILKKVLQSIAECGTL